MAMKSGTEPQRSLHLSPAFSMSTSRQSLVPEARTGRNKIKPDTVDREYNPVKHERALRYGSIILQIISISLLALVVMLLPGSDGGETMSVLPSVLNHGSLCVGLLATCQGRTCSVRMTGRDPGGGEATPALIAVKPLQQILSQFYVCNFYLGLFSVLAPLLPKVLGTPRIFLDCFNDDQQKKEKAFPVLRKRMSDLQWQLLLLYVAQSGLLLSPLGAIIQPAMGTEGASIGTGVYILFFSFLIAIGSLVTIKLTQNTFVDQTKAAWAAKGKALSLSWWGSVISWPFRTLFAVLTWPFRACWKKMSF